MATMGPLLQRALERINGADDFRRPDEISAIAAHVAQGGEGGMLPLLVQFPRLVPEAGENWASYKRRCLSVWQGFGEAIAAPGQRMLIAANAMACPMPIKSLVERVESMAEPWLVELDTRVNPTLMDDAIIDVGVAEFQQNNGALTGEGIRVAVLDSGVDEQHPFLVVSESVTSTAESTRLPGEHGTHCAGSIASRDSVFPGIAPGVTLINVKVLQQNGSGSFSTVVQGIDQALDLEAQVLSMSLGFNHLPPWSDGGHGWQCPDGRCPLCTAVDNATRFGAICVVAAGNEHQRAESLRASGNASSFDTELGCPGQARSAITVGAHTKRTFSAVGFSSHGPASYGEQKPDIAAPGVNVMSTVPAPRQADGQPDSDASRADLFTRLSGTSMATPMVAGAVALILQDRLAKGLEVTPAAVRFALLENASTALNLPANIVGSGRLDLTDYEPLLPA